MDVLVAIPTGKRLFEDTMRGIFRQIHDPAHRFDVLFVYEGDDVTADARQRVADKYNRARDVFLAGTWSHFWTVESDIILPNDALQLLAACGADVAYGLYCLRRKPHEWNAYSVIEGMESYSLDRVRPDLARAQWGSAVAVDGIGFGCTLMRRHVVEATPFRIGAETHADGERSHCDWYFALDCVAANYKQVCHLGVQCGHITEWAEDGTPASSIIWPDPTTESLHRFEVFA